MRIVTPIVSVIIPNYNHASYLPRRIESVLQQSIRNIEVLILDDCSPDNSREVINHYAAQDSRIKIVLNKQNSGSTFKQWNKGFSLAQGEYIWIAESDDFADPELLEKLVAKLELDDQIGLAYCASYTIDEQNTILDKGEDYFSNLDPTLWENDFTIDGISLVKRFMLKSNVIPNASAVVLRNSVVQQLGPADESKRLVGDWLYWASIMAHHKVAYCAEPLNYFRKHTNNVRSGSSVSGVALLEFVAVLQQMKEYGEPELQAYEDRVDSLFYMWFNSLVYSKIPLKTHIAIHKALSELDPSASQRLIRFFFSNRLSGLRMLLGDGFLFPWLKALKAD